MKRIYLIALAATLIGMVAFSSATAQQRTYQDYKGFRFAVGGGYANRLGKVQETGDPKIDDMNKQLVHGFNIDADAQYFIKESWGLGLNVNYCSSTANGNNVTIKFRDGEQTVSNYEESQNALFVGPTFVGRNDWSKFLLVYSAGIGPLFYLNPVTLDGRLVDSNQTTLGMNAGVAGEYKLNNKTGVGLKLSYTIGTVNSVNVEGQNVKYDEPMSVSNLMITAFVSFRTW